jgi:glutamyl-tRNA reductase
MALATVREFQRADVGAITVVNRSWEHAQQLARQCKVKAVHVESLWEQVLRADIVVSAIKQRMMVTREELEIVLRERKEKEIALIDISMPRTIDPNVRLLEGVVAYDLDDLSAIAEQSEPRRSMLPVAERIIATEAAGFRNKLLSESVVSTISAMRKRLELICSQEMDQLRDQFGPFTEDQEVALRTLSSHISQRIAAALARQLKEMPGHSELTGALQQLLQLEMNTKAEAKTAD